MSSEPMTANEDSTGNPVPLPESPNANTPVPGKISNTSRAVGIASIAALVALFMEIKSLMVIPMTGTFITEAGLSPTLAGWVLLSASLVGLGSTGVLSRIGDIVGHRKVLTAVLLAQLVGNALTGLAANTFMVIAGRALAGFSASTPLVLAIMRDRLDDKGLRRGIGYVSGIQGVGVSISFLFAGFFLDIGFSWRGVFLLCSGISVVCLLLVLKWVPESVGRDRVPIDWVGALGLFVWPCLIVVAITKAPAWGVFSTPTITVALLGIMILTAWFLYERRHPYPILNIRVAFGRRLSPVLFVSMSQAGSAYFCYIGVSNYVQIPPGKAGYGFGYTVLQGGFVLLPMALLVGIGSLYAGSLVSIVGAKFLMSAGTFIMGAVFLFWHFNRDSPWDFVIGAAIWALGMCWIWAGQFTIATLEAPVGQTAAINGVVLMFQAFGGTLGPAVITALTSAQLVPGTRYSAEAGWDNAFTFGAIWMGVAFLVAFLIPKGVGQISKEKASVQSGAH